MDTLEEWTLFQRGARLADVTISERLRIVTAFFGVVGNIHAENVGIGQIRLHSPDAAHFVWVQGVGGVWMESDWITAQVELDTYQDWPSSL